MDFIIYIEFLIRKEGILLKMEVWIDTNNTSKESILHLVC